MTSCSSLSLLRAPNLGPAHAFSTRAGGVSRGAYAGLNLDDRADDPGDVAENRARLAAALGFAPAQVARLDQVHGTEVVTARAGGVWTGDALVTDTPGVLLAIGSADCYPLLLADEEAGVFGAAHAGWKGTLGHIGAAAVRAMTALGARPERVRAAVGPGICGARYAVGEDVARQFREAGLGDFVLTEGGHPHLDLAGANRAVLRAAGVADVWVSGRCSTEADFYSYRRDAGVTGRMWAVIGRPLARVAGGQDPGGAA
ncbi:peptidoglycan editing factor PgeF [Deinococcus petrolearius]|uniref:Purine nucleoside phosphorylase n=1 Tax=Deinococcus petrolearius TaxID=1751295 RepID=A0ABW1DN18_9DEIO